MAAPEGDAIFIRVTCVKVSVLEAQYHDTTDPNDLFVAGRSVEFPHSTLFVTFGGVPPAEDYHFYANPLHFRWSRILSLECFYNLGCGPWSFFVTDAMADVTINDVPGHAVGSRILIASGDRFSILGSEFVVHLRSGDVVAAHDQCVVCMDKQKTHAFVPCGHMCVCVKCRDRIMQARGAKCCPLCRTQSTMCIKIWQDHSDAAGGAAGGTARV